MKLIFTLLGFYIYSKQAAYLQYDLDYFIINHLTIFSNNAHSYNTEYIILL